jgi:nitrate reductase delta subunit
MRERTNLEIIARNLEYPFEGAAVRAREDAGRLRADHPDMADALGLLAGWLEGARTGEAEEWYTVLFDLNPVCSLQLGHHLFGENFKRNLLLAGLHEELRLAGLERPSGLPDHLTTVLSLLSRLEDDASCRTLHDLAVRPALGKMNEVLSESLNPWRKVIEVLPAVIADELGHGPASRPVTPAGEEAESHA